MANNHSQRVLALKALVKRSDDLRYRSAAVQRRAMALSRYIAFLLHGDDESEPGGHPVSHEPSR